MNNDSLHILAVGNWYFICVRNIEGHIALQHTVLCPSIFSLNCVPQLQSNGAYQGVAKTSVRNCSLQTIQLAGSSLQIQIEGCKYLAESLQNVINLWEIHKIDGCNIGLLQRSGSAIAPLAPLKRQNCIG